MPADFRPPIQDLGKYLNWSAALQLPNQSVVRVELGFHKRGTEDGIRHLRTAIWQAMEAARLGRVDLLSHCMTTRHKARQIAGNS